VSSARVQKYPRDIERMIFGLFFDFWTLLDGLSGNVCGLLGMDLSELDSISAAICVCVCEPSVKM
jgi:hypothetical protein